MASQSTRMVSSKRARPEDGAASTPRRAPSRRGVMTDLTSTFGSAFFQVMSPQKSGKVNDPASSSSSAPPPAVSGQVADSTLAPGACAERPAARATTRCSPKNNRERLYGILPLPGDDNYESTLEKRNNAARIRRLHSALNEAIGETQRAIPCARCAYHLAHWEGPDEGPRPICIDGASSKCNRCRLDESGKRCVEVSGVLRAKIKALEEVAQKIVDDAGLPALYAAQTTAKKAVKQAAKAAKMPAVDEAKLAKKRQHNEERRIVAAEQQAKAMMELSKATMKIAKAIDRHGDIVERSLLLLQPMANSGLSEDAFDDDENIDGFL